MCGQQRSRAAPGRGREGGTQLSGYLASETSLTELCRRSGGSKLARCAAEGALCCFWMVPARLMHRRASHGRHAITQRTSHRPPYSGFIHHMPLSTRRMHVNKCGVTPHGQQACCHQTGAWFAGGAPVSMSVWTRRCNHTYIHT